MQDERFFKEHHRSKCVCVTHKKSSDFLLSKMLAGCRKEAQLRGESESKLRLPISLEQLQEIIKITPVMRGANAFCSEI